MSVSHDITMIEHNSKLAFYFAVFSAVCSIVSDSLMLAIRVFFSSHNGFRLSSTFHTLRFSLGSEQRSQRLPSYRYSSFTLRTYLLRHTELLPQKMARGSLPSDGNAQ